MLTHSEEHPTLIDPRFVGLPDIAHGGYISGLLGGALGGHTAEVRLKRPVPPGRRLELRRADGELVELRDGDTLLAEARPAQLDVDVPAPISLAEAEAARPGLDARPGRHRRDGDADRAARGRRRAARGDRLVDRP